MNNIFLALFIGLIAGFFAHSISMKVNFKQRTIDNKIKVYDLIITHWVKMRNFIFAKLVNQNNTQIPQDIWQNFDQMYGESQKLIGEAILVCENNNLTEEINSLNERIYRTNWHELNTNLVNSNMEELKSEGLRIVERMREDIKQSTRLNYIDIKDMFFGFFKK